MKYIIHISEASFEVEAENEEKARELGSSALDKIKETEPTLATKDIKLVHKDTGFHIK